MHRNKAKNAQNYLLKKKDIHCSYFHLKVTGSLKSSTILPLDYKNQITSAFMVK